MADNIIDENTDKTNSKNKKIFYHNEKNIILN